MRDIHFPKDIGFENTFSGENCEKEQNYQIWRMKLHQTNKAKKNDAVDCTIKNVYDQIEEFINKQKEYTEKTLAEIITNYDFIVGSKECKYRLMEVLPEGANVVCSPFIASPTMIYAIKKFDIMDFIIGTRVESEVEE